MDVKGWKAVGNKLSDQLLGGVKEIEAAANASAKSTDAHAPQQASLFGEDAGGDDIPAEKPDVEDAADKKTYKTGD